MERTGKRERNFVSTGLGIMLLPSGLTEPSTYRGHRLHLVCPRKILWWVKDRRACNFVFFIQGLDVADANPHPGSRLTLVALRQIDPSSIPSDAGEVVTTPLRVAEPEHLDVVAEAPCYLHAG
jgi:hypothetical protein